MNTHEILLELRDRIRHIPMNDAISKSSLPATFSIFASTLIDIYREAIFERMDVLERELNRDVDG